MGNVTGHGWQNELPTSIPDNSRHWLSSVLNVLSLRLRLVVMKKLHGECGRFRWESDCRVCYYKKIVSSAFRHCSSSHYPEVSCHNLFFPSPVNQRPGVKTWPVEFSLWDWTWVSDLLGQFCTKWNKMKVGFEKRSVCWMSFNKTKPSNLTKR